MESAILNSAYLGPNLRLPVVNPVCSTANCTWPNFGSLAICAELKNVTDQDNILYLRTYFQEVIRDYYNLGYRPPPAYAAFSTGWPSPSNLFNDTVTQAAIMEHLIGFSNKIITPAENADTSSFQFFVTAFYFCTKTFSNNVTLGVPYVSEVSSTLNIVSSPVQYLNYLWNESILPPDLSCVAPLAGKSIILGMPTDLANETAETYTIDACTGILLSNFFGFVTQGTVLLQENLGVALEIGQMSYAIGLALYGQFPSRTIFDDTTQFENIRYMVENMAGSITNL
jgi:hypothetical protein